MFLHMPKRFYYFSLKYCGVEEKAKARPPLEPHLHTPAPVQWMVLVLYSRSTQYTITTYTPIRKHMDIRFAGIWQVDMYGMAMEGMS
jgi:hypothetical protein